MADKDPGAAEDKLELPSLFGRKRGAKPADEADTATLPASDPDPTSAPAREAARVVEPERAPSPTGASSRVAEESRAEDTAVLETDPEPAAPTAGGARKAAKPPRERPQLPALGAAAASLVVGAVVGLLGVLLTFASLQACDALTGTDSCGGPGLLVVLVVVVVMILAGRVALAAFGVPEAGGLSFLGVAVFVAVCLVFLVEQLLEPWMVVVGPVLCALGYGAAYWLVNRFNTELLEEETPEPHDVR